jgi:hypothetical protein
MDMVFTSFYGPVLAWLGLLERRHDDAENA